jgi:hypothetical protein
MTLIAQLTAAGRPFLVSDVLVSTERVAGDQEIVLPTRAESPAGVSQGMAFVPSSFARKLIEISPNICVLCAGDFGQIRTLAFRLRSWFQSDSPNPAQIREFFNHFYKREGTAFSAILVVSQQGGKFLSVRIGNVAEGNSPTYGRYYTAGSGQEILETFLNWKAPDGPVQDIAALPTVLAMCSHMLGQEIYSGDTFRANFGGGFEIAHLTSNGFVKADKIFHMFVRVECSGRTIVNVTAYPHIIKQWYEEDSLYILSLTTLEKDLSNRGWIVPSIFSDTKVLPMLREGPLRPEHLCIHHILADESERNSQILVFSGEGVDVAKFEKIGPNPVFHLGPVYMKHLSELVAMWAERERL